MSGRAAVFHLRTLGELALYRAEEDAARIESSKALALVAFLATRPDRTARREYLARLFWPETVRKKRLRSLRQALYYVTDRADADLFRRDNGILGLRESRLQVDLWSFEQALEAGDYRRATRIYGGNFLDGFDGDVSREFLHWRESETERIWSGLKVAYRKLVDRSLAAGEAEAAVRHARAYRELNPLDEEARKLLLQALLADAREVEAYQEYEQYATLLEEELDDRPSEELRRKAGAVREQLLDGRRDLSLATPDENEEEVPRRRASPTSSSERRYFLGATALLVLGLLLFWWGQDAGTGGEIDAFRNVSTDVRVVRASSPRQSILQLRDGSVAGRSAVGWTPKSLERPGRPAQVAMTTPSPSGLDLVLVDRTAADTVRLTGRPHDEHPLGFSPDGRFLAYNMGVEAEQGRRYAQYGSVLDLESGRRRALANDSLYHVKDADWSPYGARLALSASTRVGRRDIWVVPFRGDSLHNLSRHPTADRDPAWSPEANWIAFTSRRGGDDDIFVVRPDGSELRQISRHPASDRTPVWLSTAHLGFVSDRGGSSDLWAIHLPTGERRRLTELGDVDRALAVDRRQEGRWADSVVINSTRRLAVAGEHVDLDADVFDTRGRALDELEPSLHWRGSDGTDRPEIPGANVFRVEPGADGHVRIVADLNGWRADTLELREASVRRRAQPQLLSERWTDDPLGGSWVPFGEPLPEVREAPSSLFDRAVDPRGDEHFDSGLATADPIPLDRGATITVWARAEFSQPLYQSFAVSLAPDRPGRGAPSWQGPGKGLTLKISSNSGRLSVRLPGRAVDLPLSVATDLWHSYTLQIGENGEVWVLVDGRLRWRSGRRINLDEIPAAHLLLHGRSDRTEVLFGPVRISEGTEFELTE